MSSDQVTMPKDYEAVKILLENAEIDFEEKEMEHGSKFITLDSGVMFEFDEEDNLIDIT